MSATPLRTRVKRVTAGHGDYRLGVNDCFDEDEQAWKEEEPAVVLKASAFDALLAVAKAHDPARHIHSGYGEWDCRTCIAFKALDTMDPGWRDWK